MEDTSIMGNSIIFRLQVDKRIATFSQIAETIERTGGDISGIDVVSANSLHTVNDITVTAADLTMRKQMEKELNSRPGVEVQHVSDRTFLLHLGGKIEIQSRFPVKTRDDLSRVYTPGVADVCQAIAEMPSKAHTLTIKRNTVAVVSDGTAVLGLGDIGPLAAMPVMEGKAMLFKEFADVDAFPLCLDTKDPDEIVSIIKAVSPVFGGINLEDIASPRCFEIEKRLKDELDIPVFHDDQHGTAVVILAGLLNALKLTGKAIDGIRIVISGVGAAGIACTRMLQVAGAKHIIGVDRTGAIHRNESYENSHWAAYAEMTNPEGRSGSLSDVIQGADVFIGLSAPNILSIHDVQSMNRDAIVFAMANPVPEINPELAAPYVRVLATGRSDYPNQINNVLCFPGMFRGALDCRASEINEAMKLAAAKAIASVVKDEELSESYIIPSVFNPRIVEEVRKAVIEAAYASGAARKLNRNNKSWQEHTYSSEDWI